MISAPDLRTEYCDFCEIARGEESSVDVVCEGEAWVAFFPRAPATPGHTLVIPRLHVPNLWSVDTSLAAELAAAVVHVGRAIESALIPEGMNLITSSGEAAEQTVYHLHLHVVPRWCRDGFGHIWPPTRERRGINLDGVAERVRKACGSVS